MEQTCTGAPTPLQVKCVWLISGCARTSHSVVIAHVCYRERLYGSWVEGLGGGGLLSDSAIGIFCYSSRRCSECSPESALQKPRLADHLLRKERFDEKQSAAVYCACVCVCKREGKRGRERAETGFVLKGQRELGSDLQTTGHKGACLGGGGGVWRSCGGWGWGG